MDLTLVQEIGRVGQGVTLGVLAAVGIAGLRHGFDIDHIAAISDIVSSQQSRRRSFLLATTYAIGHMLVLLALGAAAVMAGARISGWTEGLMRRLIGLTLVVLGLYVVYSLVRFRRDFKVMSRWMLITSGVRRVLHWIRPPRQIVIEHEHEHAAGHHDHHDDLASGRPPRSGRVAVATSTHVHRHTHVVPEPADPFTEYSGLTSFVIGMVHGIGAETPTQLILFTSAAGVAGSWAGMGLVVTFVVGLLLGNLVLTGIVTGGLATSDRMPLVYIALGTATALVSLWVGVAYLLGRPELLPAVLGG